jgi:hypothetical protein
LHVYKLAYKTASKWFLPCALVGSFGSRQARTETDFCVYPHSSPAKRFDGDESAELSSALITVLGPNSHLSLQHKFVSLNYF